jgi:hypothetical protein
METLDAPESWPPLPFAAWRETLATLHMWLQMVGKLKLARCAPQNHWWHVTLSLSARGLSTGLIPDGKRAFEAEFDFLDHKLQLRATDGSSKTLGLYPRSVSDFYRELMSAISSLGIEVRIWPKPVEVTEPIPFEEDRIHASYDADYARRFWRALVTAETLLKEFRSSFLGKCSPVHFFWGGMDLAVTRFSGRRAPPRPGADAITREGYSHEVISGGFWPGASRFPEAAYYAYAAPPPDSFSASAIRPQSAFFCQDFGEFFLRYEDARSAPSPRRAVLDFLQSTYEAGANLGRWDRGSLE